MASRTGVLDAVSERPRELLDDLDLRDLAKDMQKRSKDLRKRSAKAAKRTRKLSADALERAEDLRDRVGDPRDRARELQGAAVDATDYVRDRAEDLEPVLRRLVIDALVAFRAMIGVFMAVPRLIQRGLGLVGDLLDRSEVAQERAYEFSERAREAAHAVPMSRRMRRRRRVWTALLVGGGFAIGFVTGWVLANRARDAEEDELPALLEPVGDPLKSVPEGDEEPEARSQA